MCHIARILEQHISAPIERYWAAHHIIPPCRLCVGEVGWSGSAELGNRLLGGYDRAGDKAKIHKCSCVAVT